MRVLSRYGLLDYDISRICKRYYAFFLKQHITKDIVRKGDTTDLWGAFKRRWGGSTDNVSKGSMQNGASTD